MPAIKTDRVGWQALNPPVFAALQAAVLDVVERESQGPYHGCSAVLVYANAPMVTGYPVTCGRMTTPERWAHTLRALRDLVRGGRLRRDGQEYRVCRT